METKHTPIPWKCIGQIIVGGHPLEHICRWDGRPSNADLIVAAPDLLEEHKEWSELLGFIVIEALQGQYDCLKEIMTELPIIYINGSPRIKSMAIVKAGAE